MTAPWLNGLHWKPYEYNGTGEDTATPPDLAARLEEIDRQQFERRVAEIRLRNAARAGRVPLKPHGTLAAYQRHMRRNEDPCDACRDESKRAQRERKGALAS